MRLNIEKLVYGGEGLARAEKMTVFVPFVLPGEEVEAQFAERKKNFAHARLESVVSASPDRRPAPCPYFARCGGCHYQHMDYERQVEAKKEILRETLRRTGKLEWTQPIAAITAEPFGYRNRTRLRVHHAGSFEIGYHQHRSHRLVAVRECPISSPLINRVLAALWKLGEGGGFPPSIREVEFFANADDSQLLLELVLHVAPGAEERAALDAFAAEVRQAAPEVVGLSAFLPLAESADYGKAVWSAGATSLDYRAASDTYRVSAGSFFQTNRFLTERLIELAVGESRGELALDLYAGTGLFSLPLARRFAQVVAVESAPASFSDLRANVPAKVKPVRATTEDYLRQQGAKLRPELIVVDPPRAGLGDKVIPILVQAKAPHLCYVSCDPATLARDLQALVASGYRIDSLHLVDLFPQTFHMETVVRLSR